MTTGTREDEIVAAQRARFDATVAGDIAALEQAMADDLIYVHSTGRVDTKRSFIDSIVPRGMPYRAFDVEEQQVLVLGEVGIISAVILLTQRGADGDHSHRSRCSSAWALREGRWQRVFWQATRLPE